MIGASIAHYKVTAKIGAGGMGEVYRATDSKLGRDVALKVLPAAFAQDAQRMARFQREAQLLASLNHPNIATIHGLEESGTTRALVMELVEGPTLAERIAQGAIPLQEALPIARQIAEALEYAHERGVIHRDLKPANIKVTASGNVKVLDYGLAKALTEEVPQADISSSPTLSAAATKAGLILGTAAYMSPEQAKGKAADRRADIWAFGCVLYEMLTGTRTFAGETATETLAAVLREEPNWTALPAGTPAALRRLLRRALQKDAHLRLHSIADARLELQEAAAPEETATAPGSAVAPAPRRKVLPWILVGTLLFALVVVSLSLSRREKAPLVTRFTFGENVSLLFARSVAVSPDGKMVASIQEYGGQTDVSVRALDQLEAKPLRGASLAREPFFSPDGRWLGFVATDMTIRKYSFADGTISLVCNCGANSASWGDGDRIVFSETGAISEVSASGGEPRELAAVSPAKGEVAFYGPAVLPGGKVALFTRVSRMTAQNPLSKTVIEAITLDNKERKVLVENASSPMYSPTGHLLFHRDGAMLAAPFDPARLEVTGPAIRILDQVLAGGDGSMKMALSATGVLAYATSAAYELVWVDRSGKVSPLRDTAGMYSETRFSPDGTRLAVSESGALWIFDLLRQTYTLLTTSAFDRPFPVWTTDSSRVVYLSGRDVFWKRADAGGDEELLLNEPPGRKIPVSASPDGKELAVQLLAMGTTGSDVYILPLDGSKKARPFLQTSTYEGGAQFSPSGKLMAYVSYESGKRQVYVTPYPGGGSRWQISSDGGTHPRWSPAGGELFYRNGDKMMVVSISESPRFSASKPQLLFEANFSYGSSTTIANYSVSPDGKRFVMIRGVPGREARIHVVVNWFEELRRAMNEGQK